MPAATLPPAEQVFRFNARSAPLPSPEVLSEYERLVPGTAERLLQIVEQSADRRTRLEGEYLRLVARTQRLRSFLILVAVCSVVLSGATTLIVALHRPQSTASTLLTMAVSSVSGVVVGFAGGGITEVIFRRKPTRTRPVRCPGLASRPTGRWCHREAAGTPFGGRAEAGR